jgi:hypothetical protein
MDYLAHVDKLSRKSVEKGHDAYRDVPWDDHTIEPDDPRFELPVDHPLGATSWYRSRPQPERARIGLHIVAGALKTGIIFESSLKHGLLDFAASLPEGAPEFRYAYHEVIEEAQHSLMFAELLRRIQDAAPLPPLRLARWQEIVRARIGASAKSFPELFFFFVLAGEEPIDFVQRKVLATRDLHPLLRRVTQIHVTEEARHVSFARAFLAERVPRLPRARRVALAAAVPLILAGMARVMLRPQPNVIAAHAIPAPVLAAAYSRTSPLYRNQVIASLAGLRELCHELDLYHPAAWRALRVSE